MRDTNIKIIFFSLRGSGVKQIQLSWGRFLSFLSTTFIILLLLVSSILALATDFFKDKKLISLNETNNVLKSQLTDMKNKVTEIETQLMSLEREDDNLRIIADIPKYSEDVHQLGVGGFTNLDYSNISGKTGSDILKYQEILDQMEMRIKLTKESREQIKKKFEDDKKVAKHTPSIRPLIGGRLRDKFGFRLDPFTEKIKHHKGIDIAAERGTEVFATAAGVVEKVEYDYKAGRGYGRQVIINHGYGIRTRYGHLSDILVKKGQKVDRLTPIGLVGDTGRATGPHLHYEVLLEGEATDPMTYILD